MTKTVTKIEAVENWIIEQKATTALVLMDFSSIPSMVPPEIKKLTRFFMKSHIIPTYKTFEARPYNNFKDKYDVVIAYGDQQFLEFVIQAFPKTPLVALQSQMNYVTALNTHHGVDDKVITNPKCPFGYIFYRVQKSMVYSIHDVGLLSYIFFTSLYLKKHKLVADNKKLDQIIKSIIDLSSPYQELISQRNYPKTAIGSGEEFTSILLTFYEVLAQVKALPMEQAVWERTHEWDAFYEIYAAYAYGLSQDANLEKFKKIYRLSTKEINRTINFWGHLFNFSSKTYVNFLELHGLDLLNKLILE